MTPRKDESQEEFNARRRSKWIETRRTLNAEGAVTSTVEKRARGPETAVKIPDAAISRTSTLYDADGNVAQQWVQEKPEERAKAEIIERAAERIASRLRAFDPIPEPEAEQLDNLCVGYPIGDHHMGMLAWKKETGASYDMEIGARLLRSAFSHLSKAAPAGGTALVAPLGDFFHYDSIMPVTPTSGHIVDADSRFGKMYEMAVDLICDCIDIALHRHRHVRVIIEIGNHDLTVSQTLAILLRRAYRNEPRITIDISPRHYHYFVFGRVLIGTHHGHGSKLEQLPLIMATDQPEAWATSKFRYWWTGHVHSKRAFDYPGCTVESFRILPPGDAWASNKGYRSHRSMEAIVYHKHWGEVARHTVNPQMLEQGA